MKSTVLLASAGILAVVLGGPVLAGSGNDGHDRDRNGPRVESTRSTAAFNRGMHAVANDASADQRAHGWQYFSDPTARRAVVISPQGDYYYSRGKGLRWVAAAQTGN